MTAPVLYAQDAQGSSVDESAKKPKKHKHEKRHKRQKGEKSVTHSKRDKSEPLYTTPKSLSWWHGGGPAPAGAGTK
jgi:hypothetical protein